MASEGLQTVNTDVSTTDAFATNAAATAIKDAEVSETGLDPAHASQWCTQRAGDGDILKILVPGLKAKGRTRTLSVLMGSLSN